MRRVNRIEPITIGNDAGDLSQATVTTTTQMEFVRRVQVVPMVRISNCSILYVKHLMVSCQRGFSFSCSFAQIKVNRTIKRK